LIALDAGFKARLEPRVILPNLLGGTPARDWSDELSEAVPPQVQFEAYARA
jgi:hypothetical protein